MEGIRDLGMGLWNGIVGWGKCPDGGVGGYRERKIYTILLARKQGPVLDAEQRTGP